MYRPYLKYLGEFGKFRTYVVEGSYIRGNIDIEFTNFGSNADFPDMIPKDELWLDVEQVPNERSLFLGHMLASEEMGHKVGKRWETYQRSKTPNIKNVRKALLEIRDGFQVWVVDGKAVRDQFDVNFTEGGHHLRYKYIPENEIWLDDDLVPGERGPLLEHELSEVHLMQDGMGYLKAHESANLVELVDRESRN